MKHKDFSKSVGHRPLYKTDLCYRLCAWLSGLINILEGAVILLSLGFYRPWWTAAWAEMMMKRSLVLVQRLHQTA